MHSFHDEHDMNAYRAAMSLWQRDSTWELLDEFWWNLVWVLCHWRLSKTGTDVWTCDVGAKLPSLSPEIMYVNRSFKNMQHLFTLFFVDHKTIYYHPSSTASGIRLHPLRSSTVKWWINKLVKMWNIILMRL